ncbi:MAG: MOSC domain-containing protein [Planctomycetes bacterium]|nr:MOSC domain-containing protein [Planctomycetota bacterium]
MSRIEAICTSPAKGTPKTIRTRATLRAGHGLEGDAHAGDWHRQVSILPFERIEEFRTRGAEVAFGDFGENLVISGVDFTAMAIGDRLNCGEAALELSQFGKVCHSRCRIYESMGDCIMPRHGVFARVVSGGVIASGDAVALCSGVPVGH